MLIVHGIYKFGQKGVAFRNDFCLACHQPRRAVQIRSFNVLHIFWIPLIPLGIQKPWVCATCGKDPHYEGTSRVFKWLGLGVLLIIGATGWVMPTDDPELQWVPWVLRIAAPVGAVFTLWHLIHTREVPTLASYLATVPPTTDTVCPFCGTTLMQLSTQCSCPGCGVVRV